MTWRLLAFGLMLLGCPWLATAQNLPTATPESVGLSGDRLARATAALQAHVDAGDIPGVVAAVARDGRLVYLKAVGLRDLETHGPMRADALFRLYSMTRPITSLAAMTLWEEDRFELDDPVAKYLAQFASQRVFADAGEMDLARTRTREMTVERLLLRSRSSAIYRAEGVRLRSITLPEMVDKVARVPLFEDAGTR